METLFAIKKIVSERFLCYIHWFTARKAQIQYQPMDLLRCMFPTAICNADVGPKMDFIRSQHELQDDSPYMALALAKLCHPVRIAESLSLSPIFVQGTRPFSCSI